MSVYYNKKLISGVRDVPQMTLAEYNALTNKPDLWLRTDAPESDRGISASDVEYSTGVSVKDKIDEVNLKTYTVSWGNSVTVPQSLKTIIQCGYTVGGGCLFVYNSYTNILTSVVNGANVTITPTKDDTNNTVTFSFDKTGTISVIIL